MATHTVAGVKGGAGISKDTKNRMNFGKFHYLWGSTNILSYVYIYDF